MHHFPSKDQVLDFIRTNPRAASKRDIARAFGIKGAARIDLKRMLRELADAGHIDGTPKRPRPPGTLPPVTVLRVIGPDAAGDVFAEPAEWPSDTAPPRILLDPPHKGPTVGGGDRVLARLTVVEDSDYTHHGRIIRKIGHTPSKILGIFKHGPHGHRIQPLERGSDKEWRVANDDTCGAQDGALVEAERLGSNARMGLPHAKVTAVLGDLNAPRAMSLIAVHHHRIPHTFPDAALDEAEAAGAVDSRGRTDLTHLPLITIDPSDARDHDDACCALPDTDPKNPGGFRLWVAIADVAHYVRPGSALDAEARNRGNSTYFPDCVVPMLPDRLSGDLCSLHEGATRPCIAVEMQITGAGEKISHRFCRGVMTSPAALSYEEVQAAIDGGPSTRAAALLDPVLRPLYAAYAALKQARDRRGPLDIDLPERRIELSTAGDVTSVKFQDRFDAHRLIEECMILANVAAAETLKGGPILYRVHEDPNPEKLDTLRQIAEASGLKLAKGQGLKPAHLNRLLNAAAGTDAAELINIATLRSMAQAYYSPDNLSHFGLALRDYVHFTSPIRRYADLMVHRALITHHGWGDDGLTGEDIETLKQTAEHISMTERRSMLAERDTTDRYLARYMSDRVGGEFAGRVAGIAKFGVFVKLDDTGADGLVPMRALGDEYFHYDRDDQSLIGADTGLHITMGLRVKVRLVEADAITGGLRFDVIDLQGAQIAKPPRTVRRYRKRRARR